MSLYKNFYVKRILLWTCSCLIDRKQHIIAEISGLSPARMRIWQQWLLGDVTL